MFMKLKLEDAAIVAMNANAKRDVEMENLQSELETLRAENKKFRDHFENCSADKIVTLKLENERLRTEYGVMCIDLAQLEAKLKKVLGENS